MTAANSAAPGAINGTGLAGSDSSDTIDELRAGDMGAFEVLPPRCNRVTRFGIRIEADVDGAIDDAQLGQP